MFCYGFTDLKHLEMLYLNSTLTVKIAEPILTCPKV